MKSRGFLGGSRRTMAVWSLFSDTFWLEDIARSMVAALKGSTAGADIVRTARTQQKLVDMVALWSKKKSRDLKVKHFTSFYQDLGSK